MKATGIIRKIDELGRIVIPKEIRRTLRLSEGSPMEIYTDKEGSIILKKYSPIAELGLIASQYADALSQSSGCTVCMTDRDTVIAAAGSGRKDLSGLPVSQSLEEVMKKRNLFSAVKTDRNYIFLLPEENNPFFSEMIAPILSEGDVIGSVILLSRENGSRMGDTEKKLCSTAAFFLGHQMEC